MTTTNEQSSREQGQYRKKPVVITASQWFKVGDHPQVSAYWTHDPDCKGWGWIKTLEGGHIVTPGDWIITGIQGEHYPCKPEIFAATYEPVLPIAITAEEAGREGIEAELKEGAAEEILRTYLALHKGKLGAHWMWCAIEQLVAGIPEAEVMSDYGYFSTPPSALLVDKSANLQGSSVDRSTEMQGPSAPGNGEVLVRYCPGCGSVGPVEAKYRDCCPDGNEARMIPEALANKCHDTFRLAIKGAYADAAMLPPAPAQSGGQGNG